jgi:hypothetical protein
VGSSLAIAPEAAASKLSAAGARHGNLARTGSVCPTNQENGIIRIEERQLP